MKPRLGKFSNFKFDFQIFDPELQVQNFLFASSVKGRVYIIYILLGHKHVANSFVFKDTY